MFDPVVRDGWLRWRNVPSGPLSTSAPTTTPAQPRVVLECPDDARPARVAHQFADAGFDVVVCGGPKRDHPCTIAETGSCHLIDHADVVVNLLGASSGERNDVPALVRTTYPDTPVVVCAFDDHTSAPIDVVRLIERAQRTLR